MPNYPTLLPSTQSNFKLRAFYCFLQVLLCWCFKKQFWSKISSKLVTHPNMSSFSTGKTGKTVQKSNYFGLCRPIVPTVIVDHPNLQKLSHNFDFTIRRRIHGHSWPPKSSKTFVDTYIVIVDHPNLHKLSSMHTSKIDMCIIKYPH